MGNTVLVKYYRSRWTVTRALTQYDYGQVLEFDEGFELGETYDVHFANYGDMDRETVVVTGDANGAAIPDTCLEHGSDILAWIYVHSGEDDGESVYRIIIPVMKRPGYTRTEPTEPSEG